MESGFDRLNNNPKRFVLYLYINHFLNILDPKECYPGSCDEYKTFALKILDKFGEVSQDEFVRWLDNSLKDLWNRNARKPGVVSDYAGLIGSVKDLIVEKLNELYKRKWGYVDGKPLKSREFWEHHYNEFLEVLSEREEVYRDMAAAFDPQIEWLMKEHDELLLKYNSKDYVLYLYVNQELNKLDPIGWGYPGKRWDEYYDYAWEIVNLFKESGKINFSRRLADYLHQFFATFYTEKSPEFIRETADRIGKMIGEVDGRDQPQGD